MSFSLPQILEAAASHPFYSTAISTLSPAYRTLESFPLVSKYQLHNSIMNALKTDPTFLLGSYISPTGGTTGTVGNKFFFITDTAENRRQREQIGQLMRVLGAIDENDVVLNMHSGQGLYRSLELTGELIEHAGGTHIPVGFWYPDEATINLIRQLRPNAITGTCSRMLTFARYLHSHPDLHITFPKVLYTSEPLPSYQEDFMRKAFHCDTVSSLLGSAEGGIWAVAPPSGTLHPDRSYREFVFRSDMMIVEIVDDGGAPVGEGGVGEIVITSLMRLRNPLVRYLTGDVGSLHPFPGECTGHYQCLRMYGRHPDRSFTLSGDCVDLVEQEKVLLLEKWGILEWQVVLDSDHVGSREQSAEVRVVMKDGAPGGEVLDELRTALLAVSGGGRGFTADFTVRAVEYDGLERGPMANKVKKLVDRR